MSILPIKTFYSPAKVNLFLKITGKRHDGYHLLYSHFCAIDLFDTFIFEKTLDSRIHLSIAGHSARCLLDQSNLVFKAAEAFSHKTDIQPGYKVKLYKHIPIGRGLGGGSSNAATMLFALNHLHGNPLSNDDLIQLASTIGADVPFFFSSGSALCEGIGEVLTHIDMPKWNESLYIFLPPFGCNTSEVFKHFRFLSTPRAKTEHLLALSDRGLKGMSNDLMQTSFELYPELRNVYSKLGRAFREVVMSGSGSAFLCSGPKDRSVVAKMDVRLARFVCRGQGEWYHNS